MERERAEHRCRTPPNSGLFWYFQPPELLDNWLANQLEKGLEHVSQSTLVLLGFENGFIPHAH
jgi:hypothetical protein